jgi:hypothetical protein
MRIAKRHLKKQSQFSEGKMSVSIYRIGGYTNYCDFGRRKNKANCNRSAFRVLRSAGCDEIGERAVSVIYSEEIMPPYGGCSRI